MADQADVAEIGMNDPELQERVNAYWRALSYKKDYRPLALAHMQQELLWSGECITPDTRELMLRQTVIQIAYDHLKEKQQDEGKSPSEFPPQEVTGKNVKTWIARRFFDVAAEEVMAYAAAEVELFSLKKEYGAERVEQEANAVISKLKVEDLNTLLEPVKNLFLQNWQPEDKVGEERLHAYAYHILKVSVEKAVCEGKALGDTSAEIATNVASLIIKNPTERDVVLKKLKFNNMAMKVAELQGRDRPTTGDFREAIIEIATLEALDRGNYTGNLRNMPRGRAGLSTGREEMPFSQKPGNRPGERGDRSRG